MFTNDGMIVLQEMMYFIKNINYLILEIFGATICRRWDRHTKDLKDESTNRLVFMFGKYTFNTMKVLNKVGQHMNIEHCPRPI